MAGARDMKREARRRREEQRERNRKAREEAERRRTEAEARAGITSKAHRARHRRTGEGFEREGHRVVPREVPFEEKPHDETGLRTDDKVLADSPEEAQNGAESVDEGDGPVEDPEADDASGADTEADEAPESEGDDTGDEAGEEETSEEPESEEAKVDARSPANKMRTTAPANKLAGVAFASPEAEEHAVRLGLNTADFEGVEPSGTRGYTARDVRRLGGEG